MIAEPAVLTHNVWMARVIQKIVRKCRGVVRLIRRSVVRPNNLPPGLAAFKIHVGDQLWRRAASDLGLAVTDYGPVKVIAQNGRRFQIWGGLVSTENNFAAKICWDKVLTNRYLFDAGVRVPRGKAFGVNSLKLALEFANGLGCPCVTKPARNTGYGDGVSVKLTTPGMIRKGFHQAALYCDEVLVEEFVAGENFRYLVYDGEVLSGVVRQLAAITGDGERTIRQLVSAENRTRVSNYQWTGSSLLIPLPMDAQAAAVLKRQGYTWNSVPPHATRVFVSDICSYQYGSSYKEVIWQTHTEVLSGVKRAAAAVGAIFAGVDVISTDITKPDYFVNEVNTGPLLLIHYAPPTHLDPLREILRRHFAIDPG